MPHTTTPGPTTLRGRVADARATIVGTKGLRAKVATQAAALKALRARVDDHQGRLARQDQRLKDLEAQVTYLDRARTMEAAERERRDAQFGTIEVRLADLEQRLRDARSFAGTTPPDDAGLAEAHSLVDEVRTEHARIRARMQVVSAYEERLRRVEESVAELYEGDPRHLV
jgi:chromosome segregation ATPase